jgi:hypothetical protein
MLNLAIFQCQISIKSTVFQFLYVDLLQCRNVQMDVPQKIGAFLQLCCQRFRKYITFIVANTQIIRYVHYCQHYKNVVIVVSASQNVSHIIVASASDNESHSFLPTFQKIRHIHCYQRSK